MIPQDKNIETILQPLGAYIEKALRDELTRQGHVATGTLGDSVRVKARREAAGAVIEGFTRFYGRYVDTGRRPGGKRVPIDALLAWIRLRGINLQGRKERDLAFAIQYSIWKNGIPTSGNKDKTEWITRTLSKESPEIAKQIREASIEFYDIVLTNIIRNTKESIK